MNRRSFTEVWDELATETMAREYRRVGVEPGDHLGYFLKRSAENDSICRRFLARHKETSR